MWNTPDKHCIIPAFHSCLTKLRCCTSHYRCPLRSISCPPTNHISQTHLPINFWVDLANVRAYWRKKGEFRMFLPLPALEGILWPWLHLLWWSSILTSCWTRPPSVSAAPASCQPILTPTRWPCLVKSSNITWCLNPQLWKWEKLPAIANPYVVLSFLFGFSGLPSPMELTASIKHPSYNYFEHFP